VNPSAVETPPEAIEEDWENVSAAAATARQDVGSSEVEVDVVDDDIDLEDLGVTPSIPPPSSADEVPHYIEEMTFTIQNEFGITIPDASSMPIDILKDIERVMFKRIWLSDETAMRLVIARVLNALDAASYPLDGDWFEGPYKDLRNVFMVELSRHPKLSAIKKDLRRPSLPPS
jgi:hypothetical protein